MKSKTMKQLLGLAGLCVFLVGLIGFSLMLQVNRSASAETADNLPITGEYWGEIFCPRCSEPYAATTGHSQLVIYDEENCIYNWHCFNIPSGQGGSGYSGYCIAHINATVEIIENDDGLCPQEKRTCLDCGKVFVTETHVLQSTTTATCRENGVRTYVCTNCPYTYEEQELALGHNYELVFTRFENDVAVERIYQCTDCNYAKSEVTIDVSDDVTNDDEVAAPDDEITEQGNEEIVTLLIICSVMVGLILLLLIGATIWRIAARGRSGNKVTAVQESDGRSDTPEGEG